MPVALSLVIVVAVGALLLTRPDLNPWVGHAGGKPSPRNAGSRIAQGQPSQTRPTSEVPSAAPPPTQVPQSATSPATDVAPLTARATIYRMVGGAEERLVPGAQISPGDRLSMEIEGSSEMYVYVLNEDQDGKVFVLFPLPGLDLNNPLAPHTRIRLPGRLGHSAFNWQVTSVGGKESVIAIASRQPLNDLEHDIASFPRAGPGRPVSFGKVSTVALRALRGIGGLASETSAGEPGVGRRLSQALRSLSSQEGSTGNIWVWQMDLENPGK